MPKYDVLMCYEAWQMYHIKIEAATQSEAEDKAQEAWNAGGEDLFERTPHEDDGNGATVISSKEITDASNPS